jgi:hypothetical protein
MNRLFQSFLLFTALFSCVAASGAPRTVFFEHFSQEMCLTCPITADAIANFRNDYGYDDVAIISYWVQGGQSIPDGLNRGREFFDEVVTPSVIVDGRFNIPNPPQLYDSLVDAYNDRRNEPSPCTMAVVGTGGNNYTIQITAEESFSGHLVVVAYSYFSHDDHVYPCFGREFVTPYYGEPISVSAGETLQLEKTVTYSAHDGVVAWIHTDNKSIPGAKRFTPWDVLQAADSNAGATIPTPTPDQENTPTPTPPEGTPTATPEIPCTVTGATISMPSDFFRGGDIFYLDVYLCNTDNAQYNVPLFVILDVYGQLFFAPSFTEEFDMYDVTLPPNEQIMKSILQQFTWPHGAGEASGIIFYAAMTDPEITGLFGELDMAVFGWTN